MTLQIIEAMWSFEPQKQVALTEPGNNCALLLQAMQERRKKASSSDVFACRVE